MATTTDLCAVEPQRQPTGEMDMVDQLSVKYPVPGLTLGYLPPVARSATPDPEGSDGGKAPYWSWGYGWSFGPETSHQWADVTVNCGPGYATPQALMRQGILPRNSTRKVVNGYTTYFEHGNLSAYMWVQPNTALLVQAYPQYLAKVVDGIRAAKV